MSFRDETSSVTGADEVESYILLCMQESSWEFELMEHGAGIGKRCLAYTASAGTVRSVQEEGDHYDRIDKSKASEKERHYGGAV